MSDVHHAGAYWGSRPESAQECARRAELFFHLLSQCDSTYAHWYEQNSARQRPFEPTADTFTRLFGKKKHQNGRDGFIFGTWTGHEDNQGGMVMLCCGSRAETAPNSVLLFFPSTGEMKERLLTLPVLLGMIRAMALAWAPDWAYVGADDFRDLQQHVSTDVFMGWLMYFSRQWGQVPPLPEPVRVEPVEDKGTLIILGPERLSATHAAHLDLGRHVHHILAEHGLLRRIIPPRP